MIKVVTREEVMENIKNKIIDNININLMNYGQANYTIGCSNCADHYIAVKLGQEIAKLYKEEKFDVNTYEYGTSNRSDFFNISVSL